MHFLGRDHRASFLFQSLPPIHCKYLFVNLLHLLTSATFDVFGIDIFLSLVKRDLLFRFNLEWSTLLKTLLYKGSVHFLNNRNPTRSTANFNRLL